MITKSKNKDKDPITEFASAFLSDPEINKKADDMFDREMPLASIDDLFEDIDNDIPRDQF